MISSKPLPSLEPARPEAQPTIPPTLQHPSISPHLDSTIAVAVVTLLTGDTIDLAVAASATRAIAGAVIFAQIVVGNVGVNGDRAGLLRRGRTGRRSGRGEAGRSGNRR